MTEREKRCKDCIALISKGGVWCCDECFGQKCNEIDDCPEGITLEEITENDKKAKENKVKIVAQSENRKERKPRERKPDIEKENIILQLSEFLTGLYEKVEITNKSKVIEFNVGDNHYKLDLIRQRKSKK